MTPRPPTLPRAVALVLLAMVAAIAPAGAALAHNGTGGAASDYRIEITGYTGDPRGIALHVVELGNRIELRRTSAHSVVVFGYEGEPYLRLDSSGVAENVNSPAHYLNRDRFASTTPPATATADAEPRWTLLNTGSTIRWHDHRVHWMSTTPPEPARENPDVEQLVRTDHVDLEVDGHPLSATIEITWLPRPNRPVWLLAALVLGAVIAATLVLVAPARRATPALAIVAALASGVGQGASTARWIVAGTALLLGIAALVLPKRVLAVVGAGVAGVLAATRLEVFEHQLLAGVISGPGQRVAVVVALGVGLGVVAAAIVDVLSPAHDPNAADRHAA